MNNILTEPSETVFRRLMVDAAKTAMKAQGYTLTRVPGRGLSNIWNITKDGKTQAASIRTTRDRYIAFPPLEGGTKWKTLDDVEMVIVATVDSKDNPKNVEVYLFPADDVRKRFNAHYAARLKNGQTIQDNFGMWVGLDRDNRGLASSVGTGILDHYKQIAIYSIADRPHSIDDGEETTPDTAEGHAAPGISTIADVLAWARGCVAELAGVQIEAVKLDLKIEY